MPHPATSPSGAHGAKTWAERVARIAAICARITDLLRAPEAAGQDFQTREGLATRRSTVGNACLSSGQTFRAPFSGGRSLARAERIRRPAGTKHGGTACTCRPDSHLPGCEVNG